VTESAIGRRRRAAAQESRDGYSQRRREVLDAAAHVFREKGYQTATLHDVAQRIGTDRASIYYYFSGKAELLDEIIRGAIEDVIADARVITESAAPADEKLRAVTARIIQGYVDNFPYSSVMVQTTISTEGDLLAWSPQLGRQRRQLPRFVSRILEEGVRDKIFRDDLSVEVVSNAYWGMIVWSFRWFSTKNNPTPDEIANLYTSLLLSGLRRDDDAPRLA
jgi:AcrR family transcriptional regulator